MLQGIFSLFIWKYIAYLRICITFHAHLAGLFKKEFTTDEKQQMCTKHFSKEKDPKSLPSYISSSYLGPKMLSDICTVIDLEL